MKYLIALLLVISPLTDINEIAKVNKLKKEAKQAYNNGDFKTALEKYTYLVDSMNVEDNTILLNMANSYYQLKDTTQALNTYQGLTSINDKEIKSVAHQQLGIMATREKKFEEALNHFKNAIRANPSNDEARYNYELVKKMLDEQKKQNQDKDQQNKDQKEDQKKQDQQNKDQKNKDQQSKDQQQKDKQQQQDKKDKQDQEKQDQQQQDQEKSDEQKDQQDQQQGDKSEDEKQNDQQQQQGEKSEDEKKEEQEAMQSLSEKLKEMNMSEEKAKMILEALKNNEIQYIQDMKKRPTKRSDPNKPDW